MIYFMEGWALKIVNAINPAVLWEVSELPFDEFVSYVYVTDNFVFCSGSPDLIIVDVANPDTPAIISRYSIKLQYIFVQMIIFIALSSVLVAGLISIVIINKNKTRINGIFSIIFSSCSLLSSSAVIILLILQEWFLLYVWIVDLWRWSYGIVWILGIIGFLLGGFALISARIYRRNSDNENFRQKLYKYAKNLALIAVILPCLIGITLFTVLIFILMQL